LETGRRPARAISTQLPIPALERGNRDFPRHEKFSKNILGGILAFCCLQLAWHFRHRMESIVGSART
jgi:hypothetical protein